MNHQRNYQERTSGKQLMKIAYPSNKYNNISLSKLQKLDLENEASELESEEEEEGDSNIMDGEQLMKILEKRKQIENDILMEAERNKSVEAPVFPSAHRI